MGLLSFFKRQSDTPAAKPVADKADAVQVLRIRARRRLIGAAVLVAAGVIGFPLLFATQPRPLPVDLPIEIPKKDGAPALAVPAQVAQAQQQVAPAAASAAPQAVPEADDQTPPPAASAQTGAQISAPTNSQSGRVVAPTQSSPAIVPVPAPVAPKADAAPVVKPEATKPAPTKQAKPDAARQSDHATAKAAPTRDASDAARAQALLDGKAGAAAAADGKSSSAAAGNGRFIVQVGAFADASAAHEVRAKVEHLGLKTYTQAVDTPAGKRIRVRVGPFASHDDAQQAANKLHNSGLAAAVLTL